MAEGVADVQAGSSPPAATPLITSAAVIGTTDSASAEALATPGFLSASADVNAIADVAAATGTARFVGSFSDTGELNLSFDFNSIGFPLGDGGVAGATLFITLTSGANTLIEEVLDVSGLREFSLVLPKGTTSTLELVLTSEASGSSGSAPSGGFNVALVDFTGAVAAVPLPSTLLLLAIGLAAAGLLIRHRARV